MLSENLSNLQQAVQCITTQSHTKPEPNSVVEDLLNYEKSAKKDRKKYSFQQLIGTWRLCFITGTKKTRRRAGIVLGAGRYLPQWVKIQITYSSPSEVVELPEDMALTAGQVENSVQVAGLKLSLTGPVKLLKQKILAFDFTQIKVQLFGKIIYQGSIRGGAETVEKFYTESIQKQAFFAYFLVEDNLIAARGRGGGLALWGKL